MSRWPGKYVIGLTGNIGTGKSVVRRMLEHLGAYGIDADAISHRVIEKGAPGYAQVVDTFGRYILDDRQQVNRRRLGRIVFSDPEALQMLENIIHPLVSRAIDMITQRVRQQVVVIEAIKLLEGDLAAECSSIWVSYAPPDVQLARLLNKRGMSESDARQRIEAQSPQEEKTDRAQVVIRNVSTFEDTWKQVLAAWKQVVPTEYQMSAETQTSHVGRQGELGVEVGRPTHAEEIAAFCRQEKMQDGRLSNASAVMEAFGEKAFLLLRQGQSLVGFAGWQVENLVSRTTELYLAPGIPEESALSLLTEYIERQSASLQCEVAFIFVRPALAKTEVWKKLGYRAISIDQLSIPVWIEAARESMPPNTTLLLKQLREDRILRPI